MAICSPVRNITGYSELGIHVEKWWEEEQYDCKKKSNPEHYHTKYSILQESLVKEAINEIDMLTASCGVQIGPVRENTAGATWNSSVRWPFLTVHKLVIALIIKNI